MRIAVVFAAVCLAATAAKAAEPPLVIATEHHVGLVVADLAKQQAWYERAFGLVQVDGHQPTPDIRTAVLRAANGLQLELLESRGSIRDHRFETAMDGTKFPGYAHWALRVASVEDAFRALLAAGATVGKPPAPGPGGSRFAYIKDPEGNLIELIETPPSSRP